MAIRTEPAESDYITPGEAARIASVTTKTLGRLADEHRIEMKRLPSGHRRYRRGDVVALLAADPSVTVALADGRAS